MKSVFVRSVSALGVATTMVFGASSLAGTTPCPGNANGDGVVDVDDLIVVVTNFGTCPEGTACAGDLNGDKIVDVNDLILVVTNFGPCPDTPACESMADCDDQDPCTIDVCVHGVCQHIPSQNPNCGG